ncbi:hypothetical protein COU54_04650 [Candidatus Pacearchaeota archaeon CG10_big_fil_rev_8_21_14_0_10_31_24]|nr:MAG: hypothetical protein COU54_04650 [Candidatus Pacearchaeota archaeon CG10_big_fil_rev_8_21_14_0_10_31_24]
MLRKKETQKSSSELIPILIAIITLTIIISFKDLFSQNLSNLSKYFLSSIIIILIAVFSKKISANFLELNVTHKTWFVSRWGHKIQDTLKTPAPFGIILPLILSLFSLGSIKLMTLLTYETTQKSQRNVKMFQHVAPYTEQTDFHIMLVGASSIVSLLILSLILFLIPSNSTLLMLGKFSTFYALSNLMPFSRLDGAHIFYGSRSWWFTLATISILLFIYALFI